MSALDKQPRANCSGDARCKMSAIAQDADPQDLGDHIFGSFEYLLIRVLAEVDFISVVDHINRCMYAYLPVAIEIGTEKKKRKRKRTLFIDRVRY